MKSRILTIDTEFTDFKSPQLWSLGVVGENSQFYGEINPLGAQGFDLKKASNDFVKETVLTQFNKIPGSSYESLSLLGASLYRWLQKEFNPQISNPITFAFDSNYDQDLIKQALKSSGLVDSFDCFKFLNVADMTAGSIAQMVLEDCLSTSSLRSVYGIKEHHALLDAWALNQALGVVLNNQ